MSEIKAFPKIFALGSQYTASIFDGPVELTEKVDGSQFAFGRTLGGELIMRSKGKMQHPDAPDSMFSDGVEHLKKKETAMEPGVFFYAEYLRKPKHNVLAYDRIPKNHFALFGVCDTRHDGCEVFDANYHHLSRWAEVLDIEAVPLFYSGHIEVTPDTDWNNQLKRTSFLGGTPIEGFVVKRYTPWLLGDSRLIPIMAAKYVSESFKEKHDKNWKKEHTGRGKWDVFCDQFCAEARWRKAVQLMEECGLRTREPRDIGPLIKAIQRDIEEEELDAIKDALWRIYGDDLKRRSIRGFAQWYKDELLREAGVKEAAA